jgi:BirA family transcriptional regulator, biotin operon repressor / biotin---[acetyl-CoA-carboxylase] ligase
LIAETGSTNTELSARIASGEGAPEGEWLVADRQTAGRGRLGRDWLDGAGNFMGSTAVTLKAGDPPPQTLALLTGLALHQTVAAFRPGDTLKLKWPNDLMLGGAKLAGILLERVGDTVIVGIGVNLATAPQLPDRQTIALADIGATPDRDSFARELVVQFASELQRWRDAGVPALLRRWQAVAHPESTRLSVSPPGEAAISGRFVGLDDDGNLKLQLADGALRTIHAGDVMLADER